MRILAVDHGERRTGLAVSDPGEKMALALPVRPMTGDDARAIAALAQAEGIGLIVVGLPLNMDGTAGPRAKAVRFFIEELRMETEIPVEEWDERLTTAEGDARLRMAGLDRKQRAARKDTAAAIVILETYLEKRRERSA